ncbi:DUF1353 domain-containing protein [Rhizobium leguminosarum]|uniref:DUF1353 domain-containing protein n=1 Tax=Rhizobium leguminosarum TaxID=384 RepID=UPI001C96B630|nr:DUF1353 domain-containing protein [Rhizobium leguminosarum]MBY5794991.1 DUF1353 domain-containing protein [Rhizobium leguminosarum]
MHHNINLTRRSLMACLAGGLGIIPSGLFPASPVNAQSPGRFIGNLLFRPNNQGGKYVFEIIENYGYLDSGGRMWQAKSGLLTDGASIPSVFWPIVGHPYEGLYLNAAVIHDYYCMEQNRYRRWKDVHHVFYDAMLANGVSQFKAKLMFFAVWRFGPRWDISELKDCKQDPEKGEYCASAVPLAYQVTNKDVLAFDETVEKDALRAMEKRIETDKPTIDELAKLESDLPALQRGDRMFEVRPQTAKGWYFQHPYRIPLVEPKD